MNNRAQRRQWYKLNKKKYLQFPSWKIFNDSCQKQRPYISLRRQGLMRLQ